MRIKRLALAFGIMFFIIFAAKSFGKVINIQNQIEIVDNDPDNDKSKKSSKKCDQVKKDCKQNCKTPCKIEKTEKKCCDHGKATKKK